MKILFKNVTFDLLNGKLHNEIGFISNKYHFYEKYLT